MGFKKEDERKDKEYSLHVHLIIAEVGIVQRHQKKIQAESLSSLVNKVYADTQGIILLEYGISLTWWLIITYLVQRWPSIEEHEATEFQ